MIKEIKKQGILFLLFYATFGIVSLALIVYYFSDTIIHFTTSQQFPINSFKRFPLTFLIFPAEIFSFAFSMYFVYNLLHSNFRNPPPEQLPLRKRKRVAILIPVYNEPKEIVERTLAACKRLIWEGGIRIYLLDDSTNEPDKSSMLSLSRRFDCVLVRRKDRQGYKAGNLNNAVSNYVNEEFFAVLDSDQAPEPQFLQETMNYFSDSKVGFVQTPQHFVNHETLIERASMLGTNIFYHSQCISKAKDGAMPFCGTNAVVRTDVFKKVNGFSYYTSTEDIELGIRINEAGFYGAYVPKILVHGYAPASFQSYASQQYRWSNGNLAILRESWARIMFGRFSLRYQIHTFFTLGWWLIGIVSLIYVIVPMLSFFIGGTHHTWLPTYLLALLFLNVAMGISMIFMSLRNRVDDEKIKLSDAFLQYSLITNSMFIYARAALFALFRKYTGFVRTDKSRKQSGLMAVKWNLILSVACFGFSAFALYHAAISSSIEQLRTYLPISLWLLFYSIILGSSILFVGKISFPEMQSASSPKSASAPSSIGVQTWKTITN